MDENQRLVAMLVLGALVPLVAGMGYYIGYRRGWTPRRSALVVSPTTAVVLTAALWIYDQTWWAFVVGPLAALAAAGYFVMLQDLSNSGFGKKLRSSARHVKDAGRSAEKRDEDESAP